MLADFKPLIKSHKFRYLWMSQVLSQLTINIMNFLLLIKLYSATGSTIATSLLWVSFALPAIIIGPFAAAAVDMFERRRTLIITNLAQSATIFFYALSHETSIFLLYGVVMLYSFINQFYVPAEFAALPSLVRKKNLPFANGLFFMTQTASLIIGFSLAGVFNHLLGFRGALYLCSFFLLIAFLSVSLLPRLPVKGVLPSKFIHTLSKFFEQILQGYRFIKENKAVLFPFILLMLLQISVSVVVVNIPEFSTDILHVPIESSGYVLAIPIGVGAALSGLTVPKLLKKGFRKKYLIESSLLAIFIFLTILIFGAPLLQGGARTFFGVFTVLGIGYSFVGILIPAQTFLQESTPGGLRGRVFGNFWFLVTVATVFPVIFSGTITEILGVRFLSLLLAFTALVLLYLSKKYGQEVIEKSF